jgi:hypothetical protein
MEGRDGHASAVRRPPRRRVPRQPLRVRAHGRARVLTEAGEEILQAGQAYHMPPGHNVVVEEDAELVEFTPVEAERGVEHVAETRAGG